MRLMIAWRNLSTKPAQSILTVLVIAAAFGMMALITLLSGGIHNGLVAATEPFDLIAGAKGSPNQLVLNTVFLQDAPIGNVSYQLYEQLSASPLVAAAIPLAFGDTYKGYAIVGAGSGIFEHQPRAGQPKWLQLATGRPFTQPFEAVAGAAAARKLGLKPGDQFTSLHGSIPGGEEHHDHPYQIVGILQPVHGPYDHAILTSIESIWQAHEHAHEHEPDDTARTSHEHEHEHDDTAETSHEHEHEVTAVMVKPKGYSEAMRLYQQFQREPGGQLIFPAQVIVRLFAIMGQGEQVLKTIAYAIIAMGLTIMTLSVYWSALSRSRERAVLRALGAGTRDIFVIILAEAALLTGLGVAIGSLAGHGTYILLAKAMAAKTAIVLTTAFTPAEGGLIAGGVLAGLLAGIIPAVLACRTEVARDL